MCLSDKLKSSFPVRWVCSHVQSSTLKPIFSAKTWLWNGTRERFAVSDFPSLPELLHRVLNIKNDKKKEEKKDVI